MGTRLAPADRRHVLHVRQLTEGELAEVQRSERIFKENAWDEWRITQELEFDGPSSEFKVPDGFATDLVSVPNVFSWFIPRAGRYARAAVLHDYLCRDGARLNVDRRQADRRFRLQMQLDGVSLLRRWIMWAAVRATAMARLKGGPGSIKDVPGALLLLVLVALPVIALPFIAILTSTVLFWVLESIVALVVPDERPQAIQLKT